MLPRFGKSNAIPGRREQGMRREVTSPWRPAPRLRACSPPRWGSPMSARHVCRGRLPVGANGRSPCPLPDKVRIRDLATCPWRMLVGGRAGGLAEMRPREQRAPRSSPACAPGQDIVQCQRKGQPWFLHNRGSPRTAGGYAGGNRRHRTSNGRVVGRDRPESRSRRTWRSTDGCRWSRGLLLLEQ